MKRLPFLDALRGVLALVVVASHAANCWGVRVLEPAASIAVGGFFAMSGYVLARAWDGDVLGFVARRIVRLWPVYAVCLVVAAGMLGRLPTVAERVWWPAGRVASDGRWLVDLMPDPPAWSLYVEAWAALVLPLLFVVARTKAGAAVMLVVWVVLGVRVHMLAPGLFFAAGVAATCWPVRWPEVRWRPVLWLGKVSFSLYLSHDVLLRSLGPWWGLALCLPVAWGLWWAVERPSIAWSRRVRVPMVRRVVA